MKSTLTVSDPTSPNGMVFVSSTGRVETSGQPGAGATISLTGVGYLWAGWRLQAQCFEHRRVDDLLLGGILLLAAACLLLQLAVQTGPMAARSLAFWPSAATVLVSVLAGTFLMHWRAMRLARSAPD